MFVCLVLLGCFFVCFVCFGFFFFLVWFFYRKVGRQRLILRPFFKLIQHFSGEKDDKQITFIINKRGQRLNLACRAMEEAEVAETAW